MNAEKLKLKASWEQCLEALNNETEDAKRELNKNSLVSHNTVIRTKTGGLLRKLGDNKFNFSARFIDTPRYEPHAAAELVRGLTEQGAEVETVLVKQAARDVVEGNTDTAEFIKEQLAMLA